MITYLHFSNAGLSQLMLLTATMMTRMYIYIRWYVYKPLHYMSLFFKVQSVLSICCSTYRTNKHHYIDVIMTIIASQITSLTVVYSTVYSDADQSKHQSSASLTFVWGIHRDRWIPRTKGQLRGRCFHLMTSSWQHINIMHTCNFCRVLLGKYRAM